MRKKEIKKMPEVILDSDKALAFVCDSVVLIPTKATNPVFKNIDIALFDDEKPLCRLKGNGDMIYVESSARSTKIDVLKKSGLVSVYPSMGRFRVDWDGTDIHLTRLNDE